MLSTLGRVQWARLFVVAGGAFCATFFTVFFANLPADQLTGAALRAAAVVAVIAAYKAAGPLALGILIPAHKGCETPASVPPVAPTTDTVKEG